MKRKRGLRRTIALGGVLAVCGMLACRERESAWLRPAASAGRERLEASGAQQSSGAQALALRPSAAEPADAGLRAAVAAAPRLPPDVRLLPPDRPWQHLAFTEERLAQLSEEQLLVHTLPELRITARIPVPGGRNVVAGVGGDFVAAGSEHVYRLARLDTRAELLAPVPRLGPMVILPAADSSDHFWLLYEGIHRVPEFDLQETVLTPYVSVLSWTELKELDGRAVASRGDGSFIYTTVRGLRWLDAGGNGHDLPSEGVGADIWRVLVDPEGGGVWVATRSHVEYLSQVEGTEQPRRLARLELPPHTVALASQGRELAVLSVESIDGQRARLRADVHTRADPATTPGGLRLRQVLHHDDTPRGIKPLTPGERRSSAPLPRFAPEVVLAPGRPWLAVHGFGLAVYDWRTGGRRLPPEAAAQKLAPRAP